MWSVSTRVLLWPRNSETQAESVDPLVGWDEAIALLAGKIIIVIDSSSNAWVDVATQDGERGLMASIYFMNQTECIEGSPRALRQIG